MAKTLNGKIVSIKMKNVVVVEVTRKIQHPKYKKLLTRSNKFAAASNGQTVNVGDQVIIKETRPLSKTVHFVISEITSKSKSK